MKRFMQTLRIFPAAAVLGLLSCDNEPEVFQTAALPADYEGVVLETLAYTDAAFELIMQVVDAAINTAGHSHREETDAPWLTGVDVAHDAVNKVFRIDFGGEGAWPGNVQRSGKMTIGYTDLRYVYGSKFKIVLEEFKLNQVSVEGDLTLTFLSKATPAVRKYEVALRNGRLTWPDSTFITRESVHHRTVLLGSLAKHDEIKWEGVSSGVNRFGHPYTSVISDPVRFRKTCLVVGNVYPSSGAAESTMKGASVVIGYGDESCDNLADVTMNGRFFQAVLDSDSGPPSAGHPGE